jgi:hypothetical protein
MRRRGELDCGYSEVRAMLAPPPAPAPPAFKTIVRQTARPFCSIYRGRFASAVLIEQRNNRLLISTFPLLEKYDAARTARSDVDAYFAARKLDAVNRELADNLDRLFATVTGERVMINGPPSADALKTAQLQASLGQIYAHQRQAQQALAQFLGEVLYAVQEDVRDLETHAAPVAAVSMPGLPELIRANLSGISDSEQQMHAQLDEAAKECG